MATLSTDSRIEIGCGFEQRSAFARPAIPPGFDAGPTTAEHPRGPRAPTVCPGYSTHLPEVIEIAHAYRHWKEGTLHDRFGKLGEHAWITLETLGAEVSALESYCIANPRKAVS